MSKTSLKRKQPRRKFRDQPANMGLWNEFAKTSRTKNLHHNATASVPYSPCWYFHGFPNNLNAPTNLDELTKHNHQSLQASS
jgi:hypothetical protein